MNGTSTWRLAWLMCLVAQLIFSHGAAHAQDVTCHMGPASGGMNLNVDMGTWVLGNAQIDAGVSNPIQFTCTNNSASTANIYYCIGLDTGTYGTSVNQRRMQRAGSSDQLNYQLYRDAARTQVLGNPAMMGSVTLPGLSIHTHNTGVRIYGRILPNQSGTPAGGYEDIFTPQSLRIRWRFVMGNTSPLGCNALTFNMSNSSGFGVRFIAKSECALGVLAHVEFGTYPAPLVGSKDSKGHLHVHCTSQTAYKIGIGFGLHAQGMTRRMRRMTGSQTIRYALLQPTGCQANAVMSDKRWRTLADGPNFYLACTGTDQHHAVYARTSATQTTPGTYKDTVVVTLEY